MYDSYANQRQALAQIAQGVQSGAIQQTPTSTPTAGALASINTPRMGQAGGYYDSMGNYRTGLNTNPAVIAGRQTIQAGQDAMRAAGGFNGSAPQTPYTPNQPGDPFLAFGTGNQPGGVMNNLPGTINNTQNQYGAGYTGYGGSVLTASGGPVYSGQQGGQQGGGQGSSGPGNPANVPGYYAGMPQSNTRPTVMPYLNNPMQGMGVAPVYNPNQQAPAPVTTRSKPIVAAPYGG